MKTIVFLGDSVTEGCFGLYPTDYGFDTYRSPEDGYVKKAEKILCAKYGAENIKIINSGVSGDSTAKAALRVENDVYAHQPDIVVVATGLNDIFKPIGSTRENYDVLISSVKKCGAKIIVMTPNMMNTYVHPETVPCAMKVAATTAERQNDGTLDKIVEVERETAKKYGASVCDVYLYWKKLYSQGRDVTVMLENLINHPSKKMHDVAAEMIAESIEKLI